MTKSTRRFGARDEKKPVGQGCPLYQILVVIRQAKRCEPAAARRYAATTDECPNFSIDTIVFAVNAAKM
jgi:hypothetical protein